MTIATMAESRPGERRVALVPDAVRHYRKRGWELRVEAGAGNAASFRDRDYEGAEATVVAGRDALLDGAGVVLKVQPPTREEVDALPRGCVLVCHLNPLGPTEIIEALAARGVSAFAVELIPRITRAQKMDVLSSQATVAGYKAVLNGAGGMARFLPMLTTAAGTVRPATVTVLGAGVAGLQAIATARRLGARVWGYDIREAAREEVKSLGAQFVELDLELDDMQDQGGYAKALMAAKAEQQTRLLVPQLADSDVVITTAQIPGRAAPLLVTQEAVEAMKPGAVIVDLAASTGGNCSLTEPDQIVEHHHVRICGPTNLPAAMAEHASFLYARTVAAMLGEFVREGTFVADFDDEIFSGSCVTHNGEVVHPRVRALLETL